MVAGKSSGFVVLGLIGAWGILGCGSSSSDASSPGADAGTTDSMGGQAGSSGAAGNEAGPDSSQGGAGGVSGAAGGAGASEDAGDGAAGQSGQAGAGGLGGAAGAGGSSACTVLTAGDFITGGKNYVVGAFTPAIGNASVTDFINIELWESTGFKQAPGDYDLGSAPNDQYKTCTHCVLVLEDFPRGGQPARVYFQRSGTLSVASVTSPPNGLMSGSLKSVELEEVTVDWEESIATPVPGGACVRIDLATWSTETQGKSCVQGAECAPNVCDPKTLMCVEGQCDASTECADPTDVCVGQTQDARVGACYDGCVPFDASKACASNHSCVQTGVSMTEGYCKTLGAAKVGEPCTPTAASTGCAQDLYCGVFDNGNRCVETCDFWGATAPACQQGQLCKLGGLCLELRTDPAQIGAKCTTTDYISCGVDANGIAKGVCDDTFTNNGDMMCERWCRLKVPGDCPVGQECKSAGWGQEVGDCRPK